MQDSVTTKDGEKIKLNIQHAIMIKQIESNEKIQSIIVSSRSAGLDVVEFTREMIGTTDDRKVRDITLTKDLKDVEVL
jgi:lysyl-tRNA synthetase class 2